MRTPPVPFRKPVEAEPGSESAFPREDFIGMLNTMTASVSYPLVLAVDGEWGTGKTHMLQTWERQLNEELRPYVYFNAWEHDHSEDPYISFMGVVRATLPKYEDDGSKIASLFEKAVKAAPGLLSVGGRIAASAICKHVGIPAELLDGKVLFDAAQKQIESYQESHDSINAFRGELERAAESIGNLWLLKRQAAAPEQPVQERPPLLVLVDELDRCRPDFAVKLLERVKHLFNVRGLVFVFVVDMSQLQESTRTLYGQGMNSDGYFRRFFDLVIPLPEPDRQQRIKFCVNLLEGLGTAEVANVGVQPAVPLLAEFLHWLGFVFHFSLRELNQVASFADLFLRSDREAREAWMFTFLIVALRVKRNDLFKKAQRSEIDPADISGLLQMTDTGYLSSESGFHDLVSAINILILGAYGNSEEFWVKAEGHVESLPKDHLGGMLLKGICDRQRGNNVRFQPLIKRVMNSLTLLISAPPPRATGSSAG